MDNIYNYRGNIIDVGGGASQSVSFLKGVNHRGFNTIAPENTLPAYQLSKEMGFKYVECDVSFTSDNVPVLLHDSTIDRTSNGSGNITQMTFEQVRQYDFGSWKSPSYAGTKIPSLEEFIVLCRNLGLHPYIEIKSSASYTDAQIQMIVDLCKSYGLGKNVTYISFSASFLQKVKNYDANARLGYVIGNSLTDAIVATANGLKTGSNEVFIDGEYSANVATMVAKAKSVYLPLELWTIDSISTMQNLDAYISGVTSNNLDYSTIR